MFAHREDDILAALGEIALTEREDALQLNYIALRRVIIRDGVIAVIQRVNKRVRARAANEILFVGRALKQIARVAALERRTVFAALDGGRADGFASDDIQCGRRNILDEDRTGADLYENIVARFNG